jgi:hypothetical protein
MLTDLTADLSRASAKVKSEMPGRTDQAQKQAESYAAEAGHKVDNAVSFYNSHVPFIPNSS